MVFEWKIVYNHADYILQILGYLACIILTHCADLQSYLYFNLGKFKAIYMWYYLI